MAGRGHGRGRRMMSFSVEAVGISRADSLPASIQQPTPVYPVMEQKPLPLTGGEEAEYLLALKQEFRGAMRSLPCFIQPAAPQKDVERYSDKYHNGEQTDHLIQWTPDWKRLPKELRVHVKRRRTQGVAVEAHCTDGVQADQKKKKKKKKSGSEKEEVLLTLEVRPCPSSRCLLSVLLYRILLNGHFLLNRLWRRRRTRRAQRRRRRVTTRRNRRKRRLKERRSTTKRSLRRSGSKSFRTVAKTPGFILIYRKITIIQTVLGCHRV
uniref:Uncharacterized protein n=1 Tax=Sphaeramia orbicularis TaxID=375764 RepID=A0A673BWR7_9TELE